MTSLEAREAALRAVYAADQRGAASVDRSDLPARAGDLAAGVWTHRFELDEAIGAASTRWRVERMPVVDRNVLRLGLYELRYRPEVPSAVVINEAVELAKRYSTDRSGAFVNGVLAKLATEVRRAPE